jgi:hypothetical protein
MDFSTRAAPRQAVGGAARPDGRLEPDSLPFATGDPPAAMLLPDGRPPDGLTFLGAKRTRVGWLYPCPDCCRGWTVLVPASDGYAIGLEAGCSRGCDPALIHRWHRLRSGELLEPDEPDERARRYAAGVIRNVLAEMPSCRDPLPRARKAGSYGDAAGYERATLTRKLAQAAGGRATLEQIHAAVLEGAAQPGRLP